MTETLRLTPRDTALVVIDLQRGIMQMPVAPHAPNDVLARSVRMASDFRRAGATVVLVRVSFSADGRDALTPPRDFAPLVTRAEGWDTLAPELDVGAADIHITKHQWGAFYGTELDLQLRRRGIKTIVICGISTNFGVESTARDAFERGYALVFVEDAMAGVSAAAHAFACDTIFPRLGLVRSTQVVLDAMQGEVA